jgi:proteic killer suppression protein
MIRSFRDREAEALFRRGRASSRLQSIARVSQRKLSQLNAATRLMDLAIFPGNRLEALKGDRQGRHSIRINDQYRLCFEWRDGGAEEVEIVDYH